MDKHHDAISNSYRINDQERWESMPFVLGYEIKLSNNPKHHLSICKELAGIYPLWFKFTSWTEGCRCSILPILAPKEVFFEYQDAILDGKADEFVFPSIVQDVPDNFKEWASRNQDIDPVPPFIRDNFIDGGNKEGLRYPSLLLRDEKTNSEKRKRWFWF